VALKLEPKSVTVVSVKTITGAIILCGGQLYFC
jgi:hypothetical protein